MKDFIWFWKTSFEFMKPRSKLWCILHGFKPMMTFFRLNREERNK